MVAPSRTEIIHAYRNIYKHLLRAVQYSKPARFVAQDRVRAAFRSLPPEDFDPARIARTLQFLDGAATVRGLEHRILKSLMHVWWEQKTKVPYVKMYALVLSESRYRKYVFANSGFRRDKDMPFRKVAYEDFNRTIELLNESMGLCIK